MATTWEEKQQIIAREAKQRALIRQTSSAATDLVVQQAVSMAGGGPIAAIVNIVGIVGISAWQYMSGKKRQKKKQRITRQQANAQNSIDGLLTAINTTGTDIVSRGVDPTTANFEAIMHKVLYPQIGYRGNCNIIAKVPLPKKTKGAPATKEEDRPVWFTVTGNGRIFTPINARSLPPNLQTYWQTNCRGFKDIWASAYQDMLIQEGRIRELDDFQAAQKKGVAVLRISFGVILGILLIIAMVYGVKIR